MRTFLVTIITAATIVSCQEAAHEHANHESDAPVKTATTTQPAETKTLTLNNGAKWNADESTHANIMNLQSFVQKYAGKHQTMQEHKVVGDQLQQSLDNLVKQCTMKGADHDALHAWLEPFMHTVKDFNNAADVATAKDLLAKLNDQLNEYPKYFE